MTVELKQLVLMQNRINGAESELFVANKSLSGLRFFKGPFFSAVWRGLKIYLSLFLIIPAVIIDALLGLKYPVFICVFFCYIIFLVVYYPVRLIVINPMRRYFLRLKISKIEAQLPRLYDLLYEAALVSFIPVIHGFCIVTPEQVKMRLSGSLLDDWVIVFLLDSEVEAGRMQRIVPMPPSTVCLYKSNNVPENNSVIEKVELSLDD